MDESTQMELKEISICSLKLMNTHKCMNRSVTGGENHCHTEPFPLRSSDHPLFASIS